MGLKERWMEMGEGREYNPKKEEVVKKAYGVELTGRWIDDK